MGSLSCSLERSEHAVKMALAEEMKRAGNTWATLAGCLDCSQRVWGLSQAKAEGRWTSIRFRMTKKRRPPPPSEDHILRILYRFTPSVHSSHILNPWWPAFKRNSLDLLGHR